MRWTRTVMVAMAFCAGTCPAWASLTFTGIGSGLTPATIGPSAIPLNPALIDSVNPIGSPCTSMQVSPFTAAQFSVSAPVHRLATPVWGRGYLGDVYDTAPGTDLTITFSGNQLDAFAFYVTPNPAGAYGLVVSVSDGGGPFILALQLRAPLNGGTLGFCIYGDAVTKIAWIGLQCSAPMTVGQFYYHNPAPSSCALLGLAGAAGCRRRRAV